MLICTISGPGTYDEPFFLKTIVISILTLSLLALLFIILLLCLWYVKSNRRKKEFFERKNSLRSSIRSNRANLLEKAKQQQKAKQRDASYLKPVASTSHKIVGDKRSTSPDLVSQAYRNLVMGRSLESLSHINQQVNNFY